jgi:hypothetical protein
MNFDGFSTLDFPPIRRGIPEFVYVVCWVNGSEEVPFYVGKTKRVWGRLDDYYWAMFSASTDFRVGEAIRHLNAKGCRVVVKYKPSADSTKEESKIIKNISAHHTLLNTLKAFDYRTADESEERLRIHKFLDALLPGSCK